MCSDSVTVGHSPDQPAEQGSEWRETTGISMKNRRVNGVRHNCENECCKEHSYLSVMHGDFTVSTLFNFLKNDKLQCYQVFMCLTYTHASLSTTRLHSTVTRFCNGADRVKS